MADIYGPESLGKRYKEALELNGKSDKDVQRNLIFAAGFLLGSNAPGAASAIEVIFRKTYPDVEYPTIV